MQYEVLLEKGNSARGGSKFWLGCLHVKQDLKYNSVIYRLTELSIFKDISKSLQHSFINANNLKMRF